MSTSRKGTAQPAAKAAQPVYSMTGFATQQSTTDDGVAFTLTFKSVNHRFLDLNFRVPGECDALEVVLRRLVKESVKRGHVDITLFVDRRSRDHAQGLKLNRDLFAAHAQVFREAAALLGTDAAPDVAELLRVPGVLSADAPAPAADTERAAALEGAVLALAPLLLARLNESRAAEGEVLVAELRASMLRLRKLAEESAQLRTGAREAHFVRLKARLAELLREDARADEGVPGEQLLDFRILAEAALLVDRSDVEEELVRLRAHIDSFIEMLDAGGELGKRLDFLLQELNREANTMLSKTTGGDPGIGLRLTAIGLEMKTEIERAREQVQNLE
jgi:uncharacterized protein (TIGR00255 family)